MTLALFAQIILLIVIATALSLAALIYWTNFFMKKAMQMQADMLKGLDEDLDEMPPPVPGTGLRTGPNPFEI